MNPGIWRGVGRGREWKGIRLQGEGVSVEGKIKEGGGGKGYQITQCQQFLVGDIKLHTSTVLKMQRNF